MSSLAQSSNTGILVTDEPVSWNSSKVTLLSGRHRPGFDPFVVMTAVLSRAAELSQDRLVLIHGYGSLAKELGLFQRMADRVLMKYGARRFSRITQHDVDENVDLDQAIWHVQQARQGSFPPALVATNRNLCGNSLKPRLLFVGDRINPVYKNFRHWPFHANVGCTVYLAECLERIQFNESHALWTNINSDEQWIPELVKFFPSLRYVALGKEAAHGLAKLGLPCVELPHPSFARRFLRYKLDYAEALRMAVCS